MVLASVAPLHVLLFRGGVVPFGPLLEQQSTNPTDDTCPAGVQPAEGLQQEGTCRAAADDAAAATARAQDALIVNLWRNRDDAVIWDVAELAAHLAQETGSPAAFERLWRGVERATGEH